MSQADSALARQKDEDSDGDSSDGIEEGIEMPPQEMLRQALDAANGMARLQAQHLDLQLKYQALVKNSSTASRHIEEYFKKFRTEEVQRISLQSKLNLSEADNRRLEAEIAQCNEALTAMGNLREGMAIWRSKYQECQGLLVNCKLKCVELEGKYAKVVDLVKAAISAKNEFEKKVAAGQDKLNAKNREIRALKKHWNVIVRLVADVSQYHAGVLPAAIQERLDKLPLDELLQIGKSGKGGDSDDEDAEAVQRLLNADSAPATPRKGGRAARGRGSRGGRGGRGRGRSLDWGGGEVVDESIHEDLLARKLHKDDNDETPAVPAVPVGKSVMGKKTESVREQQKRMKGGMKEKIAEMKKEKSEKEGEAKEAFEVMQGDAEARRAMLQQDLMLSDDDDDFFNEKGGEKETKGVEQLAEEDDPIDFALDMPDTFDPDESLVAPAGYGEGAEEKWTNDYVLGENAVEPMADAIEMEGEEKKESVKQPDVKDVGINEEVPTAVMSPRAREDSPTGAIEAADSLVETPAKEAPSSSKIIQKPNVDDLSQDGEDFKVTREEMQSKCDAELEALRGSTMEDRETAVKTGGMIEEATSSPVESPAKEAPSTSKITQKPKVVELGDPKYVARHVELSPSGGVFNITREEMAVLMEEYEARKAMMQSAENAVKTGGMTEEAAASPVVSPSKAAPSTSKMIQKPKADELGDLKETREEMPAKCDAELETMRDSIMEDREKEADKATAQPAATAVKTGGMIEEAASSLVGKSSSDKDAAIKALIEDLHKDDDKAMVPPSGIDVKTGGTTAEAATSRVESPSKAGPSTSKIIQKPKAVELSQSGGDSTVPEKNVARPSADAAAAGGDEDTEDEETTNKWTKRVLNSPRKVPRRQFETGSHDNGPSSEDEPSYTHIGSRTRTRTPTTTPVKSAPTRASRTPQKTKILARAAAPVTPAKTPKTPTKTPAKEPKTPAKVPKTPGRQPKAPREATKTPAKAPKTPAKEPKTPAKTPKTPGRAAKTPRKAVPKSPEKSPAKPSVKAVTKTPNKPAAPKTPAKRTVAKTSSKKPGEAADKSPVKTRSKKRAEELGDSGDGTTDEELKKLQETFQPRVLRSSSRASGARASESSSSLNSKRSYSRGGQSKASASSSTETALGIKSPSCNTRRFSERRPVVGRAAGVLRGDAGNEEDEGESTDATPASSPERKRMRWDSDDSMGDAAPSTSKA